MHIYAQTLLFIYALILIITGKPFFARAEKLNLAYSLFKSTLWLRLAGVSILLILLIDNILPIEPATVWLSLSFPLSLFLVGLFKSGVGKM